MDALMFWWIIFGTMGGLFVVMIYVLIRNFLIFRHTVKIKIPVKDGNDVIFRKAKIGSDKEGNNCWFLLGVKNSLSSILYNIPPEAVENVRGIFSRKTMTGYITDTGLFIPLIDKTKDDLDNLKLQPVSREDRVIALNQIYKAKMEEKPSLLGLIGQYALPFVAIIFIAILLIFIPQYLQSVSESEVAVLGAVDRIQNTLNDRDIKIASICRNVMVYGEEEPQQSNENIPD